VQAIHRRHTDRRRFSHRAVPSGLIREIIDFAARADVVLQPVQHAQERFAAVLVDAAARQRWAPGYPAELQIWTRRHVGARITSLGGCVTAALASQLNPGVLGTLLVADDPGQLRAVGWGRGSLRTDLISHDRDDPPISGGHPSGAWRWPFHSGATSTIPSRRFSGVARHANL
jgi:hypothetical protein